MFHCSLSIDSDRLLLAHCSTVNKQLAVHLACFQHSTFLCQGEGDNVWKAKAQFKIKQGNINIQREPIRFIDWVSVVVCTCSSTVNNKDTAQSILSQPYLVMPARRFSSFTTGFYHTQLLWGAGVHLHWCPSAALESSEVTEWNCLYGWGRVTPQTLGNSTNISLFIHDAPENQNSSDIPEGVFYWVPVAAKTSWPGLINASRLKSGQRCCPSSLRLNEQSMSLLSRATVVVQLVLQCSSLSDKIYPECYDLNDYKFCCGSRYKKSMCIFHSLIVISVKFLSYRLVGLRSC